MLNVNYRDVEIGAGAAQRKNDPGVSAIPRIAPDENLVVPAIRIPPRFPFNSAACKDSPNIEHRVSAFLEPQLEMLSTNDSRRPTQNGPNDLAGFIAVQSRLGFGRRLARSIILHLIYA